MQEGNEKIYVVGHKNPDTDSICSAISYAALRGQMTGKDYVAKRAGQVNAETAYVLERFGVNAPEVLSNVRLQVKDLDIHKIEGVDPGMSIREVWKKMEEEELNTVPILKDGKLKGIISVGDIAKSYMGVYDNQIVSKARTQYRNILKTLQGTLIAGNEHGYFVKGKVTIGASDPGVMEQFIEKDDMVILGNREEAQRCAINLDASCIILCQNAEVSQELIRQADAQSIVIIRTPYDTFTTARLVTQSIPVKYFMTTGDLVTFRLNDYVDDIREIMAKYRFRDFPILDRHGNFQGFISRRRFLGARKKKLALVDHNERSQAVTGIEEAEVLEIVDHHRLGDIETTGPVFFRNQPVGCTATIVYQMYEEAGVEIPKHIAGLLCGAIISDTLLFRSPTCTQLDQNVASRLAKIADIQMEAFAQEMFRAGSNLAGKSAEDICFQDFKQFVANEVKLGVGQINSMSKEEIKKMKEMLVPYLPKVLETYKLKMVYFMLTDILDESTELLCCGADAEAIARNAFHVPDDMDNLILKGVVSRKKQLIPVLVETVKGL